jgi:ParB family transcriptional regulator, chromosome partitioning protein
MQKIETILTFAEIAGISPLNVRQADETDDLTSLKATIEAVGLINPLTVHHGPGGYLVLAGGRRWRALCEINRDSDDPFEDVRVIVIEDAADAEMISISAMENTQNRAMHQVREYEAFASIAAALPSRDAAIETIAKTFGLTRHAVRQRLALGAIAPKIRAAWLAGDIDAEAARAYAECDDIAAQEAYFDGAPHDRNYTRSIRRALLGSFVNAQAAGLRFIGEEAYRDAGGEVRENLFDEDRLFNGALVKTLAREKLERIGDEMRRAEGWGFVAIQGDDDAEDLEGVEYEPDYLPDEAARLSEIRADLKKQPTADAYAALAIEADALEAKATRRAIAAAQREKLGVYVGIDWRGGLDITRALLPRYAPDATAAEDDGGGDDADDEDDATAGGDHSHKPPPRQQSAPPPPEPEPVGKALREVLDDCLAAALHDVASHSVNLALAVAVAALGCDLGFVKPAALSMTGRRDWTPAHPLLRAIERESFAAAIARAAAAPFADVTAAFCQLVGAAIDPSRVEKLEDTLPLVRAAAGFTAIETALKSRFNPTLYFHAAAKDAAIAAIRDMDGEAAAAEAGRLKKPELTARAAQLADARMWLPKILREAAAAPAGDEMATASDAKQSSLDIRTTAEAMEDALDADGAFDEAEPDETGEFSQDDAQDEAAPLPVSLADRVKSFIAERCATGPREDVKSAQFLAAFNAWAEEKKLPAATRMFMAATLEGLGYAKHRFADGVYYQGVGLAAQAQEAAQ